MSNSEVVLAYPRDLINELLPEGYSAAIKLSDLAVAVAGKEVWGERGALKAAKETKQPIVYMVHVIDSPDASIPDMLFMYQRAKTVGEDLLLGGHSLGGGGHVNEELDKRTDEAGNLDLVATLVANAEREGNDEFNVWTPTTGEGFKPSYKVLGYINDNSNEIGQAHFAVLVAAQLEAGSCLFSKEENQIPQGNFTVSDLRHTNNDGKPDYDLESWSKITLDGVSYFFDQAGRFAFPAFSYDLVPAQSADGEGEAEQPAAEPTGDEQGEGEQSPQA